MEIKNEDYIEIEQIVKEEIKANLIKANIKEDLLQKKIESEYQRFLKLEGPDRLFNSKEVYESLDISYELNKIRNEIVECVLLIAVDEDVIKDVYLIKGKESRIDYSDYYSGGFDFIKKWYSKGAKILNYHNHPYRFAARPSRTDIVSLSVNHNLGIEYDYYDGMCELNVIGTYEDNGLDSFKYDDWGVVTKFDFFSFSQEKNKVESLFREYDNN